MRYASGLATALLILLALSSAYSQEDVMVLNTEELGLHQRPLVHFKHAKHTEIIDCSRSHHDFDRFGNNLDGEGQKCSACHRVEATAENGVSLVNAFHVQCKSCHEAFRSRGEKSGPVMCGQCHVRP
jgi:hypothetical protein